MMRKSVWFGLAKFGLVIGLAGCAGRGLADGTPPLPGENPLHVLARQSVRVNSDWIPYMQEFDGVRMALVPAGCFPMGQEGTNADEQPVHTVCFREPFWMDEHEVTNLQFAEFGGKAGSESFGDGPNQPRDRINWSEANDFCFERGGRLPTEAEWQFAARGPDGWIYPWGNAFVMENVVYWGNSLYHSWDVGSKPGGVSWIGAQDMAGNVKEWVSDWYARDYYSTLDEVTFGPQGPKEGTGKLALGGSWWPDDFILRSAFRYFAHPSLRVKIIGFRCARDY